MMIEAMVANERTKMLTLSPARRVSAKWKWWQWSGRYGPNLLHVLESTQTLINRNADAPPFVIYFTT